MPQRVHTHKDKKENSLHPQEPGRRADSLPNSAMLSYLHQPEESAAPSELEASMSARNQKLIDGEPALSPESGKALEMPQEVKAKLETHFGYSVDNLQLRESGDVQSIGAQAYAQGNVIHFGPGQFRPDTEQGQKMIGHEVAHVLQQSGGGIGGATDVNTDARLEYSADRHGDRIAGMSEGYEGVQTALPAIPAVSASAAPIQGWGISSWLGKHIKDKATKKHGYSDADSEGGHESLTRLAAEKAGRALGPMNLFGSEQAQKSLKKGTTFNDLGHHGTLGFLGKFTHLLGHDEFIDQTHEGDLQFLHSMDTSGGDTKANSKKIQRYADFASDVFQNRETDVNGTRGRLQEQNMLEYVLSQNPGQGSGAQDGYDPFQEMMLSTMVDSKKLRKFDEAFRQQQEQQVKKGVIISPEQQRVERVRQMRAQFFELSEEEKKKARGKVGGEAAALADKRKKNASRYGRGSVGDFFTGGDAQYDAGMVAMGSASHMIEDSFAGSHAKRAHNLHLGGSPDTEVGEGRGRDIAAKTTPIMVNADYTQQDSHRHAKADYLRSANTQGTNAQRLEADITATQGASLARDSAAQFLYMNAREYASRAEDRGARRGETREFMQGITQTYNDPDTQVLKFTRAGRAYGKGLGKQQRKALSDTQRTQVDAYDQSMADTIAPNTQHAPQERLDIYHNQLSQISGMLNAQSTPAMVEEYLPHIAEMIAEIKNIQQQYASSGRQDENTTGFNNVLAYAQQLYQRAHGLRQGRAH